MNEAAQIGVVISSHARPGPLKRVLESIEGQRKTFSLDVIVVDNLSDASSEIQTVVAAFPNVRLLRLNENIGFGRAINAGVAQCLAKYIYVGCDDVELGPNCLSVLLNAHATRVNAGLTAPVLYYATSPEKVCYAGGEHILGFTTKLVMYKTLPAEAAGSPIRSVTYIPGGAFLAEREVFLALGAYREDFFMYEEDTELCQRIRRTGRDMAVALEASAYDISPPHTYDRLRVQPDKLRNVLAMIMIHSPAWSVPLILSKYFLGGLARVPFQPISTTQDWTTGWMRFILSAPRVFLSRLEVNRKLRNARYIPSVK